MNIVPTDKLDLDACDNLDEASDENVISNIEALLDWTQDINWPVAPLVINRLSSIGSKLAMPINKVLSGNDSAWKYLVITSLLPKLEPELKIEISHQLRKIVKSPTENDEQEEVNIVAREFLNGL